MAPGHSSLQLSPSLGPYLPEVSEQTEVLFLSWKLLELVLKGLDVCIQCFHSEKNKHKAITHSVKLGIESNKSYLHNTMTTSSTHYKQMFQL